MSTQYTHELVDATAQLMNAYAHNIRKLVRLEHGERITLSVDYEKINGAASQVLVIVFRDENGDYFFNEHLAGDLNEALEFYAMACAPVVKEVAVDEHGADRLEDVCRDFVEEMKESENAEENTSSNSPHGVFSDESLREMAKYFPSGPDTREQSPTDDDDEIIEVYHCGKLVDDGAQGDNALTAASHPAIEPEEA
jgi:hypothetical protein